MPSVAEPTIVNVGYRSTNFWVVSAGRSRLLVDLGWPGMLGPLLANLQRMDIPLSEVTHGMATHYHIDHAGCAQELKDRGMRLIVTPEQAEAIPAMKQWTRREDHYTEIATHDNLIVPIDRSRALLASLGIGGEFVHTPGHSSDSVTVVLDTGAAFTGDLTHPSMIAGEDPDLVAASWHALAELGVTTVYGGHGPVRPLSAFW
jgi:glyoxylase-like metal-dependent hydrolase (beta-lactamase superfamily II)